MDRNGERTIVRTALDGAIRSGGEGFTLIEMSIVLVIIGLVVGGVLVGQDLIRAAYIRAQISQIEKFNTAVNTFYGKYQALPGDMNYSTAVTFGFDTTTVHNVASVNTQGMGNGDGMIQGEEGIYSYSTVGGVGNQQYSPPSGVCGETAVFWADLSSSVAGNLIEGGFGRAQEGCHTSLVGSGQFISAFVPPAKIGGYNFVYVVEINGINYFGVEVLGNDNLNSGWGGMAGMTVAQAYKMDQKVDDGMPTTGTVLAIVSDNDSGSGEMWVKGGPEGSYSSYVPVSLFGGTAATAGEAAGPTTCFDSPLGVDPTYSMEINGGAGLNCALIFKFQ